MTKIPVLTDEVQQRHAGQCGAVVDGEFVAFGKSTKELYAKAEEQGYDRDDVMIAPIPKPGAIYV